MKRLTIRTIAMLASALSLAACSNDEHTAPDPADQVEIITRLSVQSDGSSTPADAPAYTPQDGTEIHLYYARMGSPQNARFRFDGTDWQCTERLYWDHLDQQADHFPFFAASPQAPDDRPAVSARQDEADAYRLSDQLLAYTTAARRQEKLDLNFRHVLAQLKIELVSPMGDEQVDLSQVTLNVTGARLKYTLDYTGSTIEKPATATADADAPPADLTPHIVARTSGTDANGTPTGMARASFLAILPPQTATLKFVFTVAGKAYTYDDAKDALFIAGSNTSYKLTISKSNVTLGGITLQPWDDNRPATEASIKADLTGNAPSPGTGTEAIAGTAMSIWKRASADANADQARRHLYNKVSDAWSSTSPIYVDDTQADDRFYATIVNSTDDATGIPDLIAAGPARMGQGMLAFGFTHLMAQLAINVKPGTDFPAGINLQEATVTTPKLQSAFTLAYSATDDALQAAAATNDATRQPLTGLQTGVATDAAAARGETSYLVVPQTLPAGSAFTVTVGDKTYTGTLSADMPLLPGGKNVLTLTLSATQMTIGAITLQPWAQGTNENGSTAADGITDIATAISGIDQAGTLYLAATADGSTDVTGQGIYPLEIAADGKAVSSDLSRAILWDNLAYGNYIYRALYVPDAYRRGATADDNHEPDYLTAASAATPWGTAPSFDGTDATTGTALKHAMAQLTVTLTSNGADTFSPAELTAATITTTSRLSAAPSTGNATLAFTTLDTPKTVRLLPAGSTGSASKTALIAPQTLHSVVITILGKTYTLTQDLELKANHASTLGVNVLRTPLGFTVSVTDWKTETIPNQGDITVDE